MTVHDSPSALLTFLIADVRGYTRFTAEHGDEAAAGLAARFAEVAENVVGRHEGRVIELRGDEVLAVFSSARSALRAAVALQDACGRAVADDPSLPLRVGIGLDAGEAIPVRGGYRGGALNLAARLCSLAGAGEVFCSETVIGLARKTEGIAFVDRGEVMLKGLAGAVRVMQIAAEGALSEELPPLQPLLVTHPNNLPDEPTAFIGRDREIGDIVRLLREPSIRLVTLTGPGGTGKTRLALQGGSALLHDFHDGVFFVSLAPLADATLVLSHIAGVLGVKEEEDKELLESIAARLREKHLLLVLDNFEHVLESSPIVARVLDSCRDVHVLVTSRIPLHLSREQEYPVPPLAVPDPEHLPDAESLCLYESVALFIQRSGAVKPGFRVTNENAPAVAEICSRLDGLPLAIELAAARIKLFPPQALLQRVSSSLKLLNGGAKDLPARQQTLRNAIDWSYSLLTDDEKTLFARLSVFVGGCTFESAEAVCSTGEEVDVLEAIASLVDKSLLRQVGEEEPRFTMLETIREFAGERLEAAEEVEVVREQHAAYYLGVAEEAEPELQGAQQMAWQDRLEVEHSNLRSALAWFLERGEIERELRLAGALWWFWQPRNYFREGRRWLEDGLLQSQTVSVPVRMKAMNAAGAFAMIHGDQARSVHVLEELVELAREHRDMYRLKRALTLLGLVAVQRGDFREAARYLEEGLAIARTEGNREEVALSLMDLGIARSEEGLYAEAAALVEEARTVYDGLGLVYWNTTAAGSLSYIALLGGELERAGPLLLEYVEMAHRLRDKASIAASLEGIAVLCSMEGRVEHAARLFGAAATLREEMGSRLMSLRNRRMVEESADRVREQLGEAEWEAAWDEGRAMGLDEAVEYALNESE